MARKRLVRLKELLDESCPVLVGARTLGCIYVQCTYARGGRVYELVRYTVRNEGTTFRTENDGYYAHAAEQLTNIVTMCAR